MRHRTALTTAVAPSAAPEPEPSPVPGDDVFGKVARPGGDGPGARVQDVELFDATPSLPTVAAAGGSRARHRAGKPRHMRRRTRARRAAPAPEPENRNGMSLPLLITGALAAGIGLSVGLTSGMEREPADKLTLTMPDLPPPQETPDAEPPSPAGTSGPAPRPSSTTPATSPPATTTAATTPPATGRPTGAAHRTASAAPPVTTRGPVPPTRPATRRPDPAPTRTTPPPERPDTQVLRLGSTGPEVEGLQRRLQQIYLYFGPASGRFGPFLEAALSRYQRIRGIPEERGVYGPLTRAALQAETGRDDRPGRRGRGR
ncbi:peptidoglycan-binding domain-containing protein [Streptomyces sp. NBC_00691]|uniref:peptidoglycan-binding domain-containing protein n=1 Tax=Streptomyces sp. NBC_00691 TaxID=2903671 RepID=UPI002E35295F|nr:peptidoglycan-binding domain-containing protein [Streptomyces sp. NBC_00691]